MNWHTYLIPFIGIGMLSACSTTDVAQYAQEKPVLDMQQYFNGTIDAWGMFQDRSGKVVKRFQAGRSHAVFQKTDMNQKITDWRGQRVWIIGASSGIGAETARILLARGARLALSARNREACKSLRPNIPTR